MDVDQLNNWADVAKTLNWSKNKTKILFGEGPFKILIKYFVKFFDSAAHSVLNIWPKHLFVSVAERLVIVQINLIVYYEGNLGNG